VALRRPIVGMALGGVAASLEMLSAVE